MDPARPAAALYPPDPGAIVKRWSAAKTAILPRWLLAHPGSTAALHPAQLAERWGAELTTNKPTPSVHALENDIRTWTETGNDSP